MSRADGIRVDEVPRGHNGRASGDRFSIRACGPHIPVAHNCLLLAIVGLAPKAGITKLSRLESTRACAWQSDRSQVVRVFRCDDLQYPSRLLAETPYSCSVSRLWGKIRAL